MPQTLGAFLSMLVVMMFAMNFQQSALRTQRQVLSSEVDVMANAVASEAMQYLAAKPFDAAISNGTVTPSNTDLSALTIKSSFGGGIAYADAADIDDFHALTDTVVFETGVGTDITFEISFDVKYVNDMGVESTTPTWTKEVIVQVAGPAVMISPVRLTRHFSPLWY
ncbi:MAG: hypothetical protein HKN13_07390 [Rhodothermales bacterium]|nr:hypothetical protein [Rhodothermales bacterium]